MMRTLFLTFFLLASLASFAQSECYYLSYRRLVNDFTLSYTLLLQGDSSMAIESEHAGTESILIRNRQQDTLRFTRTGVNVLFKNGKVKRAWYDQYQLKISKRSMNDPEIWTIRNRNFMLYHDHLVKDSIDRILQVKNNFSTHLFYSNTEFYEVLSTLPPQEFRFAYTRNDSAAYMLAKDWKQKRIMFSKKARTSSDTISYEEMKWFLAAVENSYYDVSAFEVLALREPYKLLKAADELGCHSRFGNIVSSLQDKDAIYCSFMNCGYPVERTKIIIREIARLKKYTCR